MAGHSCQHMRDLVLQKAAAAKFDEPAYDDFDSIKRCDNKHMDFFDDEEIENVEDTLTILSKYVEGLEIQGKKKELDKIMKSLYHEALEEHNFL